MRPFKTRPFGDIVDLDDDSTYLYLSNKTARELEVIMLSEIGYALCYMNISHSDLYPHSKSDNDLYDSGYNQRKRIEKLIDFYWKNRINHYDDIKWIREQIFIFQDEIENMC